MRASVRASKTSHLSQLVLVQLAPWVAYCHNCWWRYTLKKEGGGVWSPVDPLSLLAWVRDVADEQVAAKSLFEDQDYVQLVAELGNVRSFQEFLRQLKPHLITSGLQAP